MNVTDIYRATQDVKKALIAMGYTSADCRISFNMAAPILITAEATQGLQKMIFVKTVSEDALKEGLGEIEAWIQTLPNAAEVARIEFLEMVKGLPNRAAELGIELPIKLAS